MIAKNCIIKMINSLKIFKIEFAELIGSMIWSFQQTRRLRISSISAALPGNYETNYKKITRMLNKLDVSQLSEALLTFIDSTSKMILLDFTEMVRKGANKTNYVGYLKDGKTHGYNILALSVPFKGRSKVIFADIISSSTIDQTNIGKWKFLQNALQPLFDLLCNKIIIADRELSNEEMIKFFTTRQIHYAIRLKVNSGRHTVNITDKKYRKIDISITRGSKKNWKEVYYKGNVKVNIAAEWQSNMHEALYVITNCEPCEGLKYYKKRMKIEESFKDIKDKLGFTKLMNKTVNNLHKLLLIGLIAYNLLILIGEIVRNQVLSKRERLKFSGLHVLLNMIYSYTRHKLRKAICQVQFYLRDNISAKYIAFDAFRSY